MGLAGALEQLRQKGGLRAESIENGDQEEESCIKEYLDSKLESISCLKYWEKCDLDFGSHRAKGALCRLARFVLIFLKETIFSFVSRKFLTAPPSSTDMERLFSAAGLIAADNRARLSPETLEKLEKLLFLRDNILVLNFELHWE